MSVKAIDFDDLRLRRLCMLTGEPLNMEIPEVQAALVEVESTARQWQSSLQRSPNREFLWKDLAGKSLSSAIGNQFDRLRSMALAWATPGQALYRNQALLNDTNSALEWIHEHELGADAVETGNWYDFEIAAPLDMTDIVVLLDDHLNVDQRRRYLRLVAKFDSDPCFIDPSLHHPEPSTGANRSDKAMAMLVSGALVKDEAQVTRAVDAIKTVFRDVKKGDGFYADGSFVFHGYFPYTGNYGVVLLSDVANAFYLLRGSRWDLGSRCRTIALRWATNSFSPLVFKGAMMDMVRGRLISYRSAPSHAVGHRTIAAYLRLAQTAPAADGAALRARVKRWFEEDPSRSYADSLPLDLIGEAKAIVDSEAIAPADPLSLSRVFASMDRAVHLRPNYAVGISMHSTRIQNFESINGNDLKGWHTSDGMVYLYDSDLLQFDGNFWPTVNAQRLPGSTAIARSRPHGGEFGGSSAVGGTSLDRYSAVMMQLNVFRGRLQAKKSWFLFDDEVVALGADIRCNVEGKRVSTIIENRRLRSSRAKPLVRDPNAAWVNLPGSPSTSPIGYVFPGKAPIKARREKRTGSWHDIDSAAGLSKKKLSSTYQTIWIDHGVKPKRGNYAYVLLPGKDADATREYAANPAVRIIENNTGAHAVAHDALGMTAVSFWKPGKTVAGITADAVCSVIVRKDGGCLTIAVSDPTQASNRRIHITIDVPAKKILSKQEGVEIVKLAPSLKILVDAGHSAGKPFRAMFAVAR